MAPVFIDPSGRRWRRMRRTAFTLGVMSSALMLALVAYVLVPPHLPDVPGLRTDRGVAELPRFRGSRENRERDAARRRLLASLDRRPAPRALRPAHLPLTRISSGSIRSTTQDEVTAFYVNWDDNAFASLKAHAAAIHTLVGEWVFVESNGTLRMQVDRRVPALLATLPQASRPRVLAMITNVDSASALFDARRLRALVGTPTSRARAIRDLQALVQQWGLSGIAVDLEEIPPDLHDEILAFLRDLRRALDARPSANDGERPLLMLAVAADAPLSVLRREAAIVDRAVVMLYDEHDSMSEPGPVASQSWYTAQAARALRAIPAEKAVFAIGAYGYDWNDAGTRAPADAMTFQEVMQQVRDHRAAVGFDTVSRTPFARWEDPDSTEHVAWYLDAITAWNQRMVARAAGARGVALWRLGAEDPSLWTTLPANAAAASATSLPAAQIQRALESVRSGYDVEFQGTGELLRIRHRPVQGRRVIRFDTATRLVVAESLTAAPTPWVVERTGDSPHRVALTFDDGPDPDWTPAILDTLASRHAPATFFVVGTAVERHLALTRRLLTGGHEIGSHTFTHPNLALVPPSLVGLELDANARLLEAVLDRRTVFFRAPYFGDAEPTTTDELVPAAIASDRGYVVAGLHLDSQDWQQPGAHAIVRAVLDARPRGNVVLLHDGGGNRLQTVQALGPLIDSLRARGDTLVTLSALTDGRVQGMTTLPRTDEVTRRIELAGFGVISALEWLLTWLFLLAVWLGIGRVLLVGMLALVQRWRMRRTADASDRASAPAVAHAGVSVIIPAYRERAVITQTITSLLAQQTGGPLEILVVDDGSPDDTAAVVEAAFVGDARVRVIRQANGGKASALNHGMALATYDVIVAVDADTQFAAGTIAALVQPLADPTVAAVAGNAKVGNRLNLLTRWQAIEYITSQNLDRQAFALLNGITVVPGAVGAWRRRAVLAAGGFSHDTLAEDQDLTLSLLRAGHRVAYAPAAVAWTEAPDTMRGLLRQRFRWSFGTLQCMWKHRAALLRPRYGTLGMLALPNTWIFQLLVNAIAPAADLLFAWSLLSVALIGWQHGATFAVGPLEQVLTLYAVFLLLDWGAAVLAILGEPDEEWRLVWLVMLQRFVYRQLMYWVVLRALMAAARGALVGWGTLERKGSVTVPPV